jgi:hypothetical protein
VSSFVELYLDAGATFNNVINLTDDVTNTPINVANYTISSQLRRSYYSANASANLVCSITDAANGEITLSLSAANTANLKPGRYLFDVKMIDQIGISSRILEGIISVVPQITK